MKVITAEEVKPAMISTRCPHCGDFVTLERIGKDIEIGNDLQCGQRRCPNPRCHGHLFVVTRYNNDFVSCYPRLRIDFDTTSIPNPIIQVLKEALDCHANHDYIASAIMVRRTLEEICADKGAKGKDLRARIKALEENIVLPQELWHAMDELRLLGNDAAHVEARTFAAISQDELSVAIEFTKEILKALYQYSDLLGRLRSLKKDSQPEDGQVSSEAAPDGASEEPSS